MIWRWFASVLINVGVCLCFDMITISSIGSIGSIGANYISYISVTIGLGISSVPSPPPAVLLVPPSYRRSIRFIILTITSPSVCTWVLIAIVSLSHIVLLVRRVTTTFELLISMVAVYMRVIVAILCLGKVWLCRCR